jgi:flagellar motor protein MotB
MFRKRETLEEYQENSFWISYTDILSSLLIVILLVTAFVVFELMNTKQNVVQNLEEVTKAELVRKEILTEVQKKLLKEGLEVNITDNFSVLRIPESTLTFRSNNYYIPNAMKQGLSTIGTILFEVLVIDNRTEYFDTIFIEGHTDIRSTEREMGNWGLSTFRAISVWNFWINYVSKDYENLLNSDREKLFSVSGYGESRPATNKQENEEEYKKNRRIDIRFTLRKPTSVDFGKILNLFDEN